MYSERPWIKRHFTEREIKEIEFCHIYISSFHHGTDGHNAKMIIAKLVQLLDSIHSLSDHKGQWDNNQEKLQEIMGYRE